MSAIPPGAPGIAPRWTTSAKSAVGTAATSASRVWFTISHGILNEVYAPRLDSACMRDFGFVVTARDYFSEEKRRTTSVCEMIEDGVPAFRLTNTSEDGRYRIVKTILSDPDLDVVLQDVRFEPLAGALGDYELHAIVAPHLVNAGAGNTGWYGDFKGRPALFAQGRGTALAVVSSVPWLARSVGYVGRSDGWQTLSRGEGLHTEYRRAENGNIALSGTIDLAAGNGRALLAIGFGAQPEEAAFRALISLERGAAAALRRYRADWCDWQNRLLPLDRHRPWPEDAREPNRYRVSTLVLACHRDPVSGAGIASLSVPWGSSKGDDDLGGYHLVWPRDLVETAGGLLAAGARDEAKAALEYLMAVQEADGHWLQNSWLDGRAYWSAVQMDETAFPILLYDMLRRAGVINAAASHRFLGMIRAAAGFIARNGPATQEDRWEENSGYSPFTIAVEVAALLAAADAVEAGGDPSAASYLRELADGWNEDIERWTYARDTELSRKLGLDGYYVRIGNAGRNERLSPTDRVAVHNRLDVNASIETGMLVSPDALALVRFGLRAADDPRILNTVEAIDSLLRRELPAGPYWYRYNCDGYGEHEGGAPYDGTGIGRLWPLLTGERAHYEIARGRLDEAAMLLATFEASAGPGGLLPEQIWDRDAVPRRGLYPGQPSGSAMPLAWAHAEHVKLLRSLNDGVVFDRPPQTWQRYVVAATVPSVQSWRLSTPRNEVAAGRRLRIETLEPARVRWSADGWATFADNESRDTGFGVHVCDLPTAGLAIGSAIEFALFWVTRNAWQGGANARVRVCAGG